MIPVRLPKKTKKRGRYNSVPPEKRTMDGVVFDSKAEMERFAYLQNRQRLGEITDLRQADSYPLLVNGVIIGKYTPDFEYRENNVLVIEEFKSKETAKAADYRLRRKVFEASTGLTVYEYVGEK